MRAANQGIRLWNEQHPDELKPLHPEPHVPMQPRADVDLSARIADFAGIEPQHLPLGAIADQLTNLGPEIGYGTRCPDLRRIASAVGHDLKCAADLAYRPDLRWTSTSTQYMAARAEQIASLTSTIK